MNIGFLTKYNKDRIIYAKDNGFKSIELLISPNDPLDPTINNEKDILEAKEFIKKNDITISAIGVYYINCLDSDHDKREFSIEYLNKIIKICKLLNVDIIGTVPGRNSDETIEDNIPIYKKIFTPIIQKIEYNNLKLAYENCPRFHYHPFRGVNIAYCPKSWEMIFNTIESEAVGLEYDPSHPVSMMMDYIEPIYEFKHKIFHIHLKDTEILVDNLKRNGIFEPHIFQFRLPGYGDIDWNLFFDSLSKINYKGDANIECCKDPNIPDHDELVSLKHAKENLINYF